MTRSTGHHLASSVTQEADVAEVAVLRPGTVTRSGRISVPERAPGRTRQALGLLFPAAPARSATARNAHAWWQRRAWVVAAHAAAIAGGAGLLLVRQAGTPSWSTVWAEDGSVFLPRALFLPFGSGLFREDAGYLQLVPQLIADLVARMPMADAAPGFAIAGALVASFCAVFVFHACSGHIRRPGLRALLGCSVVLLPTAVIEIANSGVDAPWYLMFAVFWALLWRPRSRGAMALAALVAFTAMGSQILNLLYLPLAVARVIALPRPREQAVTIGWLAGIAWQVPGLLESREPNGTGAEPHAIGSLPAGFHFYGQHVLVAAVAGWPLARDLQYLIGIPAAIGVAAAVVGAVVIWAVRRGGPRIWLLVAASLGLGLILSVIPSVVRAWVAPSLATGIWVPGSRYTTSAILMIDGIAIAAVDAVLRARPHRRRAIPVRRAWRCAPVLLLVLGLSVGWASSFRYANSRSRSIPWSRAYPAYQRSLRPPG
jgi:hypothetical protein